MMITTRRIVIVMAFLLGKGLAVNAQTDTVKTPAERKIEGLTTKKKEVRQREKEKLKTRVKAIDEKEKKGEISAKKAQERKEEEAQKRALNIENKLDLIDLNISLIKRNRDSTDNTEAYINIGNLLTRKKVPIDSVPRLTTGGWGIELGYGTLVAKKEAGALKGGFNLGVYVRLNTVLSPNNPRWRLDYGLDFTATIYSLKDNKIIADENNTTIFKEYPLAIKKSRFNMLNLIFPVHLEFGPAPVKYDREKAYYDAQQWAGGIGGFAGFKWMSTQSFKTKRNGKFDNVTHQRNYNTHNFLFGLSAYVKFGHIRVYGRYYLNKMFESNAVNGHAIAVGVAVGI